MTAGKPLFLTSRATGPDLHDLTGPFLVALLGGDEGDAERLVARARTRGADTAVLVRDLVAPALSEVGLMWARGEASIAEEHLATALAGRVLGRSSGAAALRPSAGRIVFACMEGEFHDVGIRLLADVAREAGWEAESLGANVPREALVAFVAQRPPAVLALSVSLAAHVPEAARSIADVREAAPATTVLVGGRAICEEPERASLTGADVGVCDAVAFRDWLRRPAAAGARGRAPAAAPPCGLPAELPASLRKRCSRGR